MLRLVGHPCHMRDGTTGWFSEAMTGTAAATAIAELRALADALRDVDAAAAAAEWDDDEALTRLAAKGAG